MWTIRRVNVKINNGKELHIMMILSKVALLVGRLFTSATTPEVDLVDGITAMLTKVGEFFTVGFTAVIGVFWGDGGLTFVGWLLAIGIAAGIISSLLAMLFGLIRNIKIGGRRR